MMLNWNLMTHLVAASKLTPILQNLRKISDFIYVSINRTYDIIHVCNLSCPVESCICVSANTSNSEATNDKESYWDVGCDGKSLEAVFFECDDFPEEGEIDYDTEEDVVGDSANVTEDRKTNSNKSSVPTDFSENDDSTPYGTPPSSLDYVGSLPKEFEVGLLKSCCVF